MRRALGTKLATTLKRGGSGELPPLPPQEQPLLPHVTAPLVLPIPPGRALPCPPAPPHAHGPSEFVVWRFPHD